MREPIFGELIRADADFLAGMRKRAAEAPNRSDQHPKRVTVDDVERAIASVHYFTAYDGRAGAIAAETYSGVEKALPEDRDLEPLKLLTFCVLVLKNGFTVVGESACVDPEAFDADIGRNVARENAVHKVWPLLGFSLKSAIAEKSA